MYAIIASVARQLARAGLIGLLLVGAASADLKPIAGDKKLQELAAWDAYGLGGGRVANVTVAPNGFSGKLHLANLPDELAPELIGFKSDSQRLYNLALVYPGKSLIALLPGLKDTALADAELPQLVVLLSPPANAGASIQLPARVGTVSLPFGGGTTIGLEDGAKALARASVGGRTAALLQAVGLSARDLLLSGRLDLCILSGAGIKNESLQTELINAIDLRLALGALAPQRKPAYLAFGDSALMMKGVGGNIAAGIATSLTVTVGSGVHFDRVTVNHDPAKRQLSIASASATPGARFLTLPIAGAGITTVSFQGLIDEQAAANDRFALAGQYAVGGSTPRDFTATLSGVGAAAQYVVNVQTETTLAQLMGWSAPGLDALVLKDVVVANDLILGDLSLRDVKFAVALFRSPGQKKFNVAFLSDDTLDLPKLKSGLQRLPVKDVQLVRPAFVLVPAENAGKSVALPARVVQHVRMPTAEFKYGLNLLAHANISGEAADLLKNVGSSLQNLAITGNLDPAILADNDGPLSEAFINAVSLKVAVPVVAPQRKPGYLAFGESVLAMQGDGGKVAWGIATSLAVNVGSGVHFDSVTLNRDPLNRQLTITSSSAPAGGNFISLPIAGAGIRQVAFTGLIDEQKSANDKFVLNGQYVVLNSSPRDFVATLSGVGASAQYAVTVQTDTKLSDLIGWSAPGLDALVLKDVSFGNGYMLGDLSLKGVKFTVAMFKGDGQSKYNAAFLSDDTVGLPTLAGALRGTPLADLQLTHPAFVLVPQENVGNAVALIAPVANHIGVKNVDLKYGVNLISHADTQGEVATLLRAAGLKTAGVLVTGNLDPSILSGSDGPLADAVINATRLQVALPAAAPQRKPAYLSFGDSLLQIKGESGKIAAALRTSVAVNVGRGLHFDPVTLQHDPVKRQLLIDSSSAKSANFITLPVAGAEIKQVAFHGVIDEQSSTNDRFALDGQYAVARSDPRDFTATLSGGTPAQYEVTVHTDTKLSDLMGWPAPGLDAVVLKDVVFGNGYALGNVSLKARPFTVVVFKGDGQAKSNAAFLSDDTFSLPKMMAALQGTPLADLELARPGFVLVPHENAGNAVKLPAAVAGHVGAPAVDLKNGLNLIANGNAYGDLGALLEKLGIDPKNLPIVGTLDPAILSSAEAAAVAQPFLDALDLRLPLQHVSLGVANATATNGYLALKGIAKGIDAAVVATLSIDANGTRLVFDNVRLGLIKAATGTTVAIAGALPGEWNRPFGINWFNVRDVKIAGSLGPTNALAVSGTTDIGSIRHLTVSVDLATKLEGGADVVVLVSGADVSLHEIPSLSSIPHIGDLKFRNLLVSARAIGGTLKSASLPLLHDVEAVAFELGGRWNLAALLGDIDLSKLMTLPSFAQPVLGKLKLGKAALLFSQVDFSGRLADLPRGAQLQFADIFGSLDGMLRALSGINLVSRFDPSSMGPAITKFLPAGQKLVLQGGIGGVIGGGTPSLALSATIPAIALPSSLGFLSLPSSARTALFVNLSQVAASAGVGAEAVIGVRLNKQTVDFDSTVAFALDKQGGVAIDLQGKSLNPWRNPMGINGFTLDPGTRIEVKAAATSELTLTFVGKTHVGAREADVTGSASIVGGVVDKGAFEAKISELTVSDVVALFNDAVKAGGGQPITADFPDAQLKNVDLAFASPGVSLPEIDLPNGGTRLAGDLWFLLKGKPLSRVKTLITETNFAMTGDISDFTLGPVAMKGNKLDIRAQTSPPLPPIFKISGGATIMGKHVDGEIDSGLTETAVVSAIDLGGLLNLDLHASFDTPLGGLDAGGLAAQDLALNAHLKSDIGKWLGSEGKKAVSEVFDSVGSGIKKLVSDIETAQKAVDKLDGDIAKARARATAGAKTVDQQIAQAQKKVNDLGDRVNSLNRDISSERDAIGSCNYSISICYWWNWRGHCTKHKDVPNVARDAECEANNGRRLAEIAANETALRAAQAAKLTAEGVLEGIRKGEKGVDIASLDPEVIALEASMVIADAALQTAKTIGQGAELGIDQLKSGLAALDRVDSFKLTGSSISGNFQKAVAGKPVVLGMDFEVVGKPQHLRLALSLTDPAYNAKQFDTLALLVAKTAIEALPNASPAVTRLLNDAFKSRHDTADKEVELAAKDNGLE